jgi:chemotaxis protein methyltransferase CheR
MSGVGKLRRSDTREPGPSVVPGEFHLTWSDFEHIAKMLQADAGIHLPQAKVTLVYSRLAKRLRALGLETFHDYCALVASDEGTDERQRMLAALTTNVTRFFREPHHFTHLKEVVLPPLLAEVRRGGEVRFWSAGCSNGQEPYSIALTILSLMPDAARYNIRILATDIDPNMVAEARKAEYDDTALKTVDVDLRNRWFTPLRKGDTKIWSATGPLRELVGVRELNLFGNWPMSRRFQVIFCRNVVIYFDDRTQKMVWSRFVPVLAPGGRLYIGHSERISGDVAAAFETDGITTYKLRRGQLP